MSNIYVQEPPCEGKVTLETTVGDIDIELWSREAPKAARNFLQLCLEGYYTNTKFFRVVPDFIVQGGDPTNTGTGGESVYGKPFKDEFHQRLRMVRRGLVCMANAGKDDNGSQFFFTLAATRELQNKHTVFGKVAGDTIFNMLRLATGHLEDGDRPKYPHRITGAKVQVNPFDDIVPRAVISQEMEKGKKKKKSKAKAHKAFNVLSFGAEAEEEEEDLEKALGENKGKAKSAHDLANDPKLRGDVDEHQARDELGVEESSSGEEETDDEDEAERRREQAQKNLDSVKNKLVKRKAEKVMMDVRTKVKKTDAVEEFIKKEQGMAENDEDFEGEYECPLLKKQAMKKQEIQKELKALTKELRPKKKKTTTDGKVESEEEEEKEVVKNHVLETFHKEQKRYAEVKASRPIPKQKASREEQTMALLAKFKAKLSGFKAEDDEEETKEDKEGEEKTDEKKEDEDNEEIEGDDWMNKGSKGLVFDNDGPIVAKDASTKDDDWFDIYDPRNPINKRRREADASVGRLGGQNKEKDRRTQHF